MNLDFEKMGGLIPAIIQDNYTQKVLMLGFMNEEAYQKTVETGKVTFFSRTKNRLWTKGEESGNFLNVIDIKADCDNDTLLIQVDPVLLFATNKWKKHPIFYIVLSAAVGIVFAL